MFIKLTEHF